MKHYSLAIEGMGCAACVRNVTEALKEKGAEVESCAVGSARVAFDGEKQLLIDAVLDRGYDVTGITEG